MRGPVKLWMATIVIGVVLKSSIIDAKIIKHTKLAPETQFRDMKAGPLINHRQYFDVYTLLCHKKSE